MDEESSGGALGALVARVEALEREVAELRGVGRVVPSLSMPVMLRPRVWGAPAGVIAAAVAQERGEAVGVAPVAAVAEKSLEDRLGAQVFNRIAIVALLVGVSLGLKLAIDHGFIGPVARTLIGLAAGAGLVVWSERFRGRGFGPFSYSLKAVGTGVLYLTLWAAFHLYGLLPGTVALVAMMLVTAWNAYMAWAQDSEVLGAYALTGGFATPLLLSTGGNHEVFLFTYIAGIDLATVLLVRLKPWPRLVLAALVGTVGFYIGWYTRWFLQSPEAPFGVTVAYTLLFFGVFALASVRGFGLWEREEVRDDARGKLAIQLALVPLLNAAFVALGLYSVLEDTGRHDWLPWVMLGLAAVSLGLMRVQRGRTGAAIQLALGVVFLTVAIALKASGHTLTVAWLVEGVALLWVATLLGRAGEGEEETLAPEKVLRVLSVAGFVLGFGGLCVQRYWFDDSLQPGFLNAGFLTALVGVGCFAGATWLLERRRVGGEAGFGWIGLVGVGLTALLLTLREILHAPGGYSGQGWVRHAAFANGDFAMALVGLAVLGGAGWWAYRLREVHEYEVVAAGTSIAFNLFTLLVVEHEISSLWTRREANLQRSLAISGFLMLYGAGLLAAGFWRRNAFIRWQGLALLTFTILKVFLYDVSGLSAGYRVASFLGLGALLMGVSFAYQKDWLALKVVAPEMAPVEPHEAGE